MKKRVVAILMATVVAVGLLAGCGTKGKMAERPVQRRKGN